jgi:hypothetical protein
LRNRSFIQFSENRSDIGSFVFRTLYPICDGCLHSGIEFVLFTHIYIWMITVLKIFFIKNLRMRYSELENWSFGRIQHSATDILTIIKSSKFSQFNRPFKRPLICSIWTIGKQVIVEKTCFSWLKSDSWTKNPFKRNLEKINYKLLNAMKQVEKGWSIQ